MKQNVIPLYLHCDLIAKLEINKLIDESMNEGIDLSYSSNGIEVSYNPNHQNGINAKVDDNPTLFDLSIPSINIQDGIISVYSILQRTPMKVIAGSSDGNPLVYAFKNENGYSFKSDYDKKTIQDAIDEILKKFIIKYFSTIRNSVATIVCPSENSLNQVFAYAFRKNAEMLGKTINIQEDYLVKYPVDDIRAEIIDNANSDLNRWLISLPQHVAMKKRTILDNALDKMDDEHNGVFAYHLIKDVKI